MTKAEMFKKAISTRPCINNRQLAAQVTDDGELMLCLTLSSRLDAKHALELGKWLVSTFGE